MSPRRRRRRSRSTSFCQRVDDAENDLELRETVAKQQQPKTILNKRMNNGEKIKQSPISIDYDEGAIAKHGIYHDLDRQKDVTGKRNIIASKRQIKKLVISDLQARIRSLCQDSGKTRSKIKSVNESIISDSISRTPPKPVQKNFTTTSPLRKPTVTKRQNLTNKLAKSSNVDKNHHKLQSILLPSTTTHQETIANGAASSDTESEIEKAIPPSAAAATIAKNKNGKAKNININEFDSRSNSHYESDELDDNNDLSDDRCKTPGCDSLGHLSGAFLKHHTTDACPIFHNQTAEECRERYRNRIELLRKLKHRHSSPVKSPIRKTPLKSKNSPTKIPRSPEKDTTWISIMNQRKADLKAIADSQMGDVIPPSTSSQLPRLNSFAPSFDLNLFIEAQSRTAQLMHYNCIRDIIADNDEENDDQEMSETEMNRSNALTKQSVVLGKHQMEAWYASPYSDEFQNCQILYICEFCLKCLNSPIILARHTSKCALRHPPGNEIYRKGNISFFEIDGQKRKEYCQNLCLLAKLFLNHKTLFFDVDPFLFYIMTECDDQGMHIVGYFSKEKHSPFNYNVSCILTLPSYQRNGYGRMLIEFSYLLTKSEGKSGSPEKPLSDLGLISYRNYWKFAIMEYITSYEGRDLLLKGMSHCTGINTNDIVSTLQLMGLLKYWKGNHLVLVPPELKKQFAVEVKKRRKLYGQRVIDPKCFHWTPKIWPEAADHK